MDEQQADLLRVVLVAYGQVARALHARALPTWLRLDLPLPQLKVLLLVAEDPLSIGAVASRLCISRAAASLLVDRLVQRGLVSRRDDPVDRRRAMVRLTDQGSDLVGRLYPGPQGDPCRHLPEIEVGDLLAFARSLQALDLAAPP